MNYERIYYAIIEKAKKANRVKGVDVYYEAHHIIPECLGGSGRVSQWKNHPNIILLTGKEHFICHRLLCKIHPENRKLAHAFWGMCNQSRNYQERYVPSLKAYEEAKNLHAIAMSQSMKGHTLNQGRKQSEEHVRNRMKSGKNRVCSNEQKYKISKANSKCIKNIKTNVVYKSLSEAASEQNCSVANISYHLRKGLYIII